jgi:hypothetical protein
MGITVTTAVMVIAIIVVITDITVVVIVITAVGVYDTAVAWVMAVHTVIDMATTDIATLTVLAGDCTDTVVGAGDDSLQS